MTKVAGLIIGGLIIMVVALVFLLVQEKDEDTTGNSNKQTTSVYNLLANLQDYKESLVGLSEDDAVKKIMTQDLIPRVVSRDDEQFVVTHDLRSDRVNLWVRDNHVTKVDFY